MDNVSVQDKSFELSTDDPSFLNFASSGLDNPKSNPASNGGGPGPLPSMTSDNGPDAQSTDVGFEKPKADDTVKKPMENMSMDEVGSPAMVTAGAVPARRADSMSWAILLYEYSQGTTMHGLPYITHHARFVLRR